MGIEGAGAHPFDAILNQLDGTTGKEKHLVTVHGIDCEVFEASAQGWTVYIDGYALDVSAHSDGSLVVNNHANAPTHYKDAACAAVRQLQADVQS